MDCRLSFFSAALLISLPVTAAQWDEGMDDDAGKAKATSRTDLPAADYENARKIYPKRDRLYTTSLDGTWAFKLVNGLDTPDDIKGWNEPGYDTREWDDIAVPGNWETQGFKSPQYGNQIDEMSGFYVRNFRWNYRWESQRVILRFDGVLFGYEVWLNGKYVGRWGSAYNLAQWDVTDKLVKGRNTIAVKVMTRSHAWLFDTNDCWALAGIFRSVELFTVPDDYIEDIVFRTEEAVSRGEANDARVSIDVDVGTFGDSGGRAKTVYVSLVDDDGLHALDFELPLSGKSVSASGVIPDAHLWSAGNPYLYTLVVTLVDGNGGKIERIAEHQGVRVVRIVDKHLEVNGELIFLNGVAWNEIDPVLGRAITEVERRKQMTLMKKAGVNCIRTAHYPFGPDFLKLADEMGFYVIDEIPFGSRGAPLLKNREYKDELITRTEATMRRDKNHASVIFWTFGNENTFTSNTKDVLAYAKAKDPTRPRGLPQIGSSQAKETMYHPERDVDFVAPHYLSPDNMREYEKNTMKPLVQTEFAHACGNGFNDFEDRYRRMRERPDVWMGGCIWAWIDQSVMHDEHNDAFDRELSLTRTKRGDGEIPNHQLPKDLRRDLPREFQGNYLDPLHFIDSWGDRATDGIVYGDGTPKDGYWLVKSLYAGKNPQPRPAIDAPKQCGTVLSCDYINTLLLRIDRKAGMDRQIQIMGKPKPYHHDPYLLEPTVLGMATNVNGALEYSVRYTFKDDESQWIEGTIALGYDEQGKIEVSYDLKPNDACAAASQFTELGLTIVNVECGQDKEIRANRVDWVGEGPLTGVPGKSKMNSFGHWAIHKDDYRFLGNRTNVKWAMATRNVPKSGNNARSAFVLESGTGNVSFENIDGYILLTENFAVAGYGGKSSGPSGLKKASDIKMKGSCKFYLAFPDTFDSDVVPDLTYTSHYGF